jgi:hypothetical protein
MNAKIIQIAVTPETEEQFGSIVALTENGQIFRRQLRPFKSTEEEIMWVEISTPGFVKRLGKLIGD